MANPTVTEGITIIAHQLVTHPNSVFDAPEIDVTNIKELTITLYHAPIQNQIQTNPGEFHIQFTPYASGDEGWATLFPFVVSNGTPVTEALTATETAPEKSIAVASTTGFVAKDEVYIKDGTVLGDSEWATIDRIVANTSIELAYGLTTSKDSGDAFWSQAEKFIYTVNCAAKARIKVVFLHEGATGADVHIKGEGVSVGYQ